MLLFVFWISCNSYSYNGKKRAVVAYRRIFRPCLMPAEGFAGSIMNSAITSPISCDYVTRGADRRSLLTFLLILAAERTAPTKTYSAYRTQAVVRLSFVGLAVSSAAEWAVHYWPVVTDQAASNQAYFLTIIAPWWSSLTPWNSWNIKNVKYKSPFTSMHEEKVVRIMDGESQCQVLCVCVAVWS